MREVLSDIIAGLALKDEKFLMLSGDHGYALFDKIRREASSQFINVGVAEQFMVGFAAGLAKVGFRPMVYGLSAFLPIRVLEQIKVDVCFDNLPVVFLGDGAGLVYSTLGISHQCGEDIAVLSPLPNISIYTPCDEYDLKYVLSEAMENAGPSYIRIGKSDRPRVYTSSSDLNPINLVNVGDSRKCIVSMGSMLSISANIAKDLNLKCVGISRIKPFPKDFLEFVDNADALIVIEEHNNSGGLASAISSFYSEAGKRSPLIKSLSLKSAFTKKCGTYQYALSEHQMDDSQILKRVKGFLNEEF